MREFIAGFSLAAILTTRKDLSFMLCFLYLFDLGLEVISSSQFSAGRCHRAVVVNRRNTLKFWFFG